MAGLREKKKTDRNKRIQNAAIKLFGTQGYEATTMRGIAQEAELGVGTLYNYYKSKGEILLSIIDDKSEEFVYEFDDAIKNRKNDIFSSVSTFFGIYIKSFSIYNKRIWREFLSAALTKQPSIIEYIWAIDSIFIKKFTELLQRFAKDGLIGNGIDFESISLTFYSVLGFHILKYISDEDISIEVLKESFEKQIRVLIAGLI
ncbi:MAG: TetR/AcrR family transcriptional regulator [Clostridia bacterium]|nr:TetR/AcrR family transcriptional regulator [Clostridia bacterium]